MPDTEIRPSRPVTSTSAVDVLVGAAFCALALPRAIVRRVAGSAVAHGGERATATVEPILAFVARASRVSNPLQTGPWISGLGATGRQERRAVLEALNALLDEVVPYLIGEVLRRGRIAGLVVRYVDLDEVIASVDLDRAVAGVDIDRIVARLDLNAVASALDVDAVAARLDVTAFVDRLDVTAIVLRHVDLEALVNAVLDELDLIALAQKVIEGVGLTEIIRESTGIMASDSVRGARMRGIAADQAISRVFKGFRTDERPQSVHDVAGGPAGLSGPPS